MGKKILTVDDSMSIRQTIMFTLSDAGYDVVEAVDGVDGLSKAKENSPDLVLTDLNMPNMDGIGLIKAVRQEAALKYTPIVVITTESQDALKAQAKQAGATAWIVKPFKADQLLGVVKKVVG